MKFDKQPTADQSGSVQELQELTVPDKIASILEAGVSHRVEEHRLRYTESDGTSKSSTLEYDGITLKLSYDGHPKVATLTKELTREQWSWVTRYADRHADALTEPAVGPESYLAAGVEFARLHAAFYGSHASPWEAAKEFTRFIRYTLRDNNSDWRDLRMETHTKQSTHQERFDRIMPMASSRLEIDRYVEARSNRGEEKAVLAEIQRAGDEMAARIEADAGAALLDGIIGADRHGSVSLDDLVTNMVARFDERRDEEYMPARVDLAVMQREYPLYRAYLHIEKAQGGYGLAVYYQPHGLSEKMVTDLKSLTTLLWDASKGGLKNPRWPELARREVDTRRFGT